MSFPLNADAHTQTSTVSDHSSGALRLIKKRPLHADMGYLREIDNHTLGGESDCPAAKGISWNAGARARNLDTRSRIAAARSWAWAVITDRGSLAKATSRCMFGANKVAHTLPKDGRPCSPLPIGTWGEPPLGLPRTHAPPSHP